MDTKEYGQRIMATREELARRFPKCFQPKGAIKLPLAIGTREAVADRAIDIPYEMVAHAIRNYVRGRKYQEQMVAGAVRIDLDGNMTGMVTEHEANGAVSMLRWLEGTWARRSSK